MGKKSEGSIDDGHAPLWGSSRLMMTLVGFFGFMNLYMQRVNMSVALICMVNTTAIEQTVVMGNHTEKYSNLTMVALQCPVDLHVDKHTAMVEGSFVWSKKDQGITLGAFFWGYMTTQLLGGLLAGRIGGKRVFGGFMLLSSLFTLLTPLAANTHLIALIVVRVLCGMSQGVVFPATHSMWSKWAPPLERSILVGLAYAGTQVGNVVTFPVSGMLCASVGWEMIFYLFGVLGIVWAIIWLLLTSDSPAKHKRISARERRYIERSLHGQRGPPWASIVTSMPVWAIVVSHTTALFATYLVLTTLPSYMSNVLKFNIKENGFLSAIPYVAFFIVIQVATQLADLFRARRWLNTTHVRKLSMIIALVGQAGFLVATGYLGNCHNPLVAVALITAAQGISGFQFAGFMVNMVDIAPRYAGILFGISNTFATVSGIVAPYVAMTLAPDGTAEQWLTVFWVSASILIFGAAFNTVFCSGEIQPWAIVPDRSISMTILNGMDRGEGSKEMKQLIDT